MNLYNSSHITFDFQFLKKIGTQENKMRKIT